ncbi:ATP-binding protein [Amycolatopsis sp. H20-H5]|uniref:ATP-binding protein n=1 Tax=Amycolatopsis sp. H20-H5 TaxID=3046309 RepID=UPI002DBA2427|nr:tetratricopeptide repeat protein [Amycolatopsis sp. H20-H5]MEC3982184.1 tetratricopeptide repeat protein [Amycolatopsis sp. H20-H5]
MRTRSELSGTAGEVVQARDVHGGVHFHGAEFRPGRVPHQLPADVRSFVNRAAELARLDQALAGDLDEPMVVAVTVIAGTAGVGKTSLALHWAHRVGDRFPDGQLYVNLHGHDPGPRASAEQVLDRFLRALGVPAGEMPVDLDDRAAHYRSLLAGRRMLIILDNAATAGQVRPLLPGTAGCLVVVTSRSHLSGLVFREGAHRVSLDVLSEAEAVSLLGTVLAGYRAEAAAEELAELARLCARLPLALRIAAERAARRPRMPLSELIEDLRDESGLWDALSTGDDEEVDAVRTVFAWSYRALPDGVARLFRLLGVHPALEFSVASAAALAGVSLNQAKQLLEVLVDAHLVEQTSHGRYQCHDLLRSYATDQARQEETGESRQAALRRVLDWYLQTADRARAQLSPQEPSMLRTVELTSAAPPFAGQEEALRWYESERPGLVAATRAAAGAGLHRIAWQLPATLRGVYMNFNPFGDWVSTGQVGLASARTLGDRAGEVELLDSLAMAYTQSHRFDEATRYHRETLALRRELGDSLGEAIALSGLGLLHLRRRELAEARSAFGQGLALVRALGNRYWQALVLGNLAETCLELAEHAEAASLLREALEIFEGEDDYAGEGNALYLASVVEREQGRPEQASAAVERALGLARLHGSAMCEAHWLLERCRVLRAAGSPEEALVPCQRAAAIQRRLGDRGREAQALDETGETYRALDQPEEAANFFRLTVSVHRDLGDRWRVAASLDSLSKALSETGDAEEASRCAREALTAFAAFDDPRAAARRIDLQRRL